MLLNSTNIDKQLCFSIGILTVVFYSLFLFVGWGRKMCFQSPILTHGLSIGFYFGAIFSSLLSKKIVDYIILGHFEFQYRQETFISFEVLLLPLWEGLQGFFPTNQTRNENKPLE